MTKTTDQSLAKLEAFCRHARTDEQAILGHLLSDDDGVSGFIYPRSTWAVVSGPIPFANLRPKIDAFVSPQASATFSDETGTGEI